MIANNVCKISEVQNLLELLTVSSFDWADALIRGNSLLKPSSSSFYGCIYCVGYLGSVEYIIVSLFAWECLSTIIRGFSSREKLQIVDNCI